MYQSHADQAAGRSYHTSHTGHPLGAQTQGQQAETGTPLKCVIGGSRGLPGLFICHEKVKVKGKVKSESWLPSKLQMWGLEWWGLGRAG